MVLGLDVWFLGQRLHWGYLVECGHSHVDWLSLSLHVACWHSCYTAWQRLWFSRRLSLESCPMSFLLHLDPQRQSQGQIKFKALMNRLHLLVGGASNNLWPFTIYHSFIPIYLSSWMLRY